MSHISQTYLVTASLEFPLDVDVMKVVSPGIVIDPLEQVKDAIYHIVHHQRHVPILIKLNGWVVNGTRRDPTRLGVPEGNPKVLHGKFVVHK